ncbi:hypothetical protein [Polymorphospora sp. NPDC050346]|uniref:hypothetical protein n=1 Tax=Polymorphospora sp. NPDC050346 TaxID=3155780 RepID=UPI0033FAFAAC
MADPAAGLRHVYWLGGGSGAGKSTVARRIADRHGLRLYATDDMMPDHAARGTADECPYLHRFMAMDMDERWVRRSPALMLETFHWFRGEGFAHIVDDLLRLPTEPGILVEGFRLLPYLVKPLLATPAHAVWLLPTPAFRRAAFASRGSLWTIAGRTSVPERALRNLLERDRMFTQRLREETGVLGLHAVDVDPSSTEDGLVDRVTRSLGL